MRALVVIVLVVFVATLAVVLGSRLPTDAMTVVIGVVCGVLASIPTSVLILAVANRRETSAGVGLPVQSQYPPVVVVNAPPQGQSWPGQNPAWAAQMPPPSPRQFHIIGQSDDISGFS